MRGTDQNCGCCQGLAAQSTQTVENRPGLPAIAYRIGTHAQILSKMLAQLSSSRKPELNGLRTREKDDFSIGLMDAWATVADVLAFYQERIANESFLGTATERRSILELGRLMGYELRPGVSASTLLAFTLEQTPGSPRKVVIDAGAKVQSVPEANEIPQTFETTEPIEARVEWNAIRPRISHRLLPKLHSVQVYLVGTGSNLKLGDAILIVDEPDSAATLPSSWAIRNVSAIELDYSADRTRVEWIDPLPKNFDHPTIFALRQKCNLFGYNAPHPRNLAKDTLANYEITDHPPKKDWPFSLSGSTIDLDIPYPAITTNSWLIISQPGSKEIFRVSDLADIARADFTLSGKLTRLTLSANIQSLSSSQYRSTTVLAQSEPMAIAESPLSDPITGKFIDLAERPFGLSKGQTVVVFGESVDSGSNVCEAVTLAGVFHQAIEVQPDLQHRYRRHSVIINANIVRATHGETVLEVLGSGDSGLAFQQFRLRQTPLTFVSASNATGAESTLQLFVDDIQWHETEAFYGHGPADRVYIVRSEDDGSTIVRFGDGVTGSRVPSGNENVRAIYRKGLGRSGNLQAEQLSILMTRPLGAKSVINPIPASGGDDSESLAMARQNAPMTVLTLDRLVSLQDYEVFSRSFAGIGKSLATLGNGGGQPQIIVTVAGPEGTPIDPKSEVFSHLVAALVKLGDPTVSVRVQAFQAVPFWIVGSFRVEDGWVAEKVKSAVDAALQDHFAFDARQFGQSVTSSEVIATIHQVPGVKMVDINALVRADGFVTTTGRLRAALDSVEGVELLMLDATRLNELKVIS